MFQILALASFVTLALAAPTKECKNQNQGPYPASLEKSIYESGAAIESVMQHAIDEGMKLFPADHYSRLLQSMLDSLALNDLINCDDTLNGTKLEQLANNLEAKRSQLIQGDMNDDPAHWIVQIIRGRVLYCKSFERSTMCKDTHIEILRAIRGQAGALVKMIDPIALELVHGFKNFAETNKELEWVNEMVKVFANMLDQIIKNKEIDANTFENTTDFAGVENQVALIAEKLGSQVVPDDLKTNLVRVRKSLETIFSQ